MRPLLLDGSGVPPAGSSPSSRRRGAGTFSSCLSVASRISSRRRNESQEDGGWRKHRTAIEATSIESPIQPMVVRVVLRGDAIQIFDVGSPRREGTVLVPEPIAGFACGSRKVDRMPGDPLSR